MILEFSIENFRFEADSVPHPSNFSIFLKSRLKISYGYLMKLRCQNFSITFFPNPSIFKASLEIKCFNFSIDILSQS